MSETPTYEQLVRQVRLLELSVSSLQNKLRRVQHISKSRILRLSKTKEKLVEAELIIKRMQREAHGG